MAQNPLGINQGTNSFINFDLEGTVNTQIVNIGTINGNLPGGSIAVTSLSNIPGGTLGSVSGIGSITNIGSISTIGTMPSISANPTSGTLNTLGTLGTVQQVNNIGTLPNLPQGSINITAGTIGTVGNIGTLPNLPGGTINILAGGTLGILTNGTLSSSGTTTGVGSVSNIGSIAMLNAGTIVNNGGSIQITDNTNIGAVAPLGTASYSKSNQNGQLIGAGYGYFAGSASSNGTFLGTQLAGNYRWACLQLGGTFTGTVNLQASNDGTNFGNLFLNKIGDLASLPAANFTGTNIYFGHLEGYYTQLTGSFASGTVNYTLITSAMPGAQQVAPVNISAGLTSVGTIGTIGIGSIIVTSGTQQALGTIGTLGLGTITGSIQINQIPTIHVTSYGTLGTAGAGSTYGTIQGTVGSGTEIVITDWSIVAISGTPTVSLGWGTTSLPFQGTTLIEGGAFPAGGGIAKGVDTANHSGTNGQLVYGITGGTALFKVAYQTAVTTI